MGAEGLTKTYSAKINTCASLPPKKRWRFHVAGSIKRDGAMDELTVQKVLCQRSIVELM